MDNTQSAQAAHKVLFWNVNRQDPGPALRELCLTRNVDTVVLAEAWPSVARLGPELSDLGIGGFFDATGGAERLKIFSRLPFSSIVPKADGNGISIRHISPVFGLPFLLVSVHLPSKLHYKQEDQTLHAANAVDLIHTIEDELGHRRTIVIGDFNMDPFEPGMAAAGAFHAVMDRNVASRKKRRIQGRDFPFFYNPMWSRIGDGAGRVPGTFRRAGSTYLEYFWRTFDQVLLGSDLLDRVPDSSVEIINNVGSHLLVDARGKWSGPSDHLPILVGIS